MINRRFLGVGVVFLLIGGCASQPKLGVSSAPNKNGASPQLAEPKSEASGTPAQGAGPGAAPAPDLLANKTAEYANSLNGAEVANPGDFENGSKALFADPAAGINRDHRHKNDLAQPTAQAAPAAVVDESASPKPNSTTTSQQMAAPTVAPAQTASAHLSSRASSFNDAPQIVPESADFISTGSGSDTLGQRLMKRARENPRDISNQLDLQLFGMLNDDQSPELASMSAMPADDRELVSALVDGLSNFRANVRQDANMLPAQKIKPLLEMAERLRSQADLTVSTVALCRRVEAFGKYDPIVPARLPAMKESRVIVYCEVENFLAKQNSRQMWETNLTEQVTLYTDTGLVVWSDEKRRVTDECRNRRHDFFAFNIVSLPGTLSVGRYVMKVTISDDNADRVAEATVPVSVTAQ